jgi:hypothetical protein
MAVDVIGHLQEERIPNGQTCHHHHGPPPPVRESITLVISLIYSPLTSHRENTQELVICCYDALRLGCGSRGAPIDVRGRGRGFFHYSTPHAPSISSTSLSGQRPMESSTLVNAQSGGLCILVGIRGGRCWDHRFEFCFQSGMKTNAICPHSPPHGY